MLDRLARVAQLDQRVDPDLQVRADELLGHRRVAREVFTPSGVIGLSDTSSSAPLGMWLTKPTTKIVAVSMSIAAGADRRAGSP